MGSVQGDKGAVSAKATHAGQVTYLFKWKELDYCDCTWEDAADAAELGFQPLVDAFHALKPLSQQAAANTALGPDESAAAQSEQQQRSATDARTYTATPAVLQV